MSFDLPEPDEPAFRRPPRVPRAGRRGRVLVPTLVVLGVLLLLFGLFTQVYTDLLWFRAVGFSVVWRVEVITKIVLFLVLGLLMAAVVLANIVLAYRMRPMALSLSPEQQSLDRYRMALDPVRRWILLALGLVIVVFAGTSAAGQWRTFLLWRDGGAFGRKDAEFHLDLGFYVFQLPLYRYLLGFAVGAVIISLLVAAVVHYLYGGIRLAGGGDRTSRAAQAHLSVLLGVLVLLKAVAYWLDRYALLMKDHRVFTGASYADINAVMPAKVILAVISIICALLFFANVVRRTWLLPGLGVGLLLLSAILIGGIWPALVQQFQVKPSEADREAKFISRNITATGDAFQLTNTETTTYDATGNSAQGQLSGASSEVVPGVRLLDPTVLPPTFTQLQQIKPYYGFPDSLDVDRYNVQGTERDMVVAVRELNVAGIPNANWINTHTVYTHGFGFVGAYGNVVQPDGRPSFAEGNIPPSGVLGSFEPRVYFGELTNDYVIAGAPAGQAPRELDYPETSGSDTQARNTYTGKGGVPVGSLFNRLLYTVKFQEQKILLSDAVNADSKILYIRKPADRVEKVAPWLTVDGDPYPAVVNGRIVWILDGYTTSDTFPYAEHTTLSSATIDSRTGTTTTVTAAPPETVNYLRNAVKATVDAYDGTVTLYQWDTTDPVLKAWSKAFPGTVQPKSAISPQLMAHLRYPQDMFKVQRQMLARYHVTDPATFYSGQDQWRVPDDPTKDAREPQPPFYLTLQLPKQSSPTFSLMTTFVPGGGAAKRENLTAFAAVDAAPGPNYGKIRVLQVPANTAVNGPAQIQGAFEANTTVSSQLSLLRQGGSTVQMGNLLTMPAGGGFVYIEPVYVRAAAAGSSYPLLQRILVGFGDKIGFAPTLQEALDQVFGGSAGNQPPATPPSQNGGTPSTPSGSVSAAMARAIADANQAMADAQKALRAGDWAAYGQAQKALEDALKRAQQLSTPAPSGSPSPTPAPSGTPSPGSPASASPPASPGA